MLIELKVDEPVKIQPEINQLVIDLAVIRNLDSLAPVLAHFEKNLAIYPSKVETRIMHNLFFLLI